MKFLPLSPALIAFFFAFKPAFADSPIFELSGIDPGRWDARISLESASNQTGALYFEVQYSGSDDLLSGYRTFIVTFESGYLNPASISNGALLLNLKVYPITRFNKIDGMPVGLHLGTTSFLSDYSLGVNALGSIKLLGISTRFQIPSYEEFYVALGAQALGAYLFRAYAKEKLGPSVSNQGPALAYGEANADVGVRLGQTKAGAPAFHVTLLGGSYELGENLSLGELYTEFTMALTEDTRAFLRFGRRWISDPTAGVNGDMTDYVRLGFSKSFR